MSSHIVRHIRTAHKEKALKSLPSQKPATPSEDLREMPRTHTQLLGGRSRFLRREALERFFLVCRSDVTDDVRAHISCLYMAALSKEEKYRELYDNYQLLDRCDAALREAAKHAERVAHLEREHAARELQIKQAQARVTELKDLQRSSNENHARALAAAGGCSLLGTACRQLCRTELDAPPTLACATP
ncbi:hypothetical protein ABMX48_36450 [Streptomyces cavourensis]